MVRLITFESPPADYPNHLAGPRPEQPRRAPAYGWLLLLLLAACAAPRIVTAVRMPIICIDGPVYVDSARALDAGDLHAALFGGTINLYPAILMLLHRLGLEWETAGAVWGVLISSLVVLPLWGWVRRQFDDRVALAACLLYIVHPKFIVESPEVTRDPTFWFLFMASVYLLWRAVVEVRYVFFFAAGATMTLAALTRVEGLFLLIPLTLWTFWRWRALQERRDKNKLLIGALLCVPAFAVLILALNVTLLYEHLGWIAVRVRPLARVQLWLGSLMGFEPAVELDRSGPPAHLGRMLRVFFPTMTRGLAPLYALLMFGGIWKWRRVWARRDHQAMFYTAMVLVCGIWVQLWCDGNISRRYPLPIVLMASPFAALALLTLAAQAERFGRWLGWSDGGRRAAAAATVAFFLVAGVGHAMKTTDRPRLMAADVGRWVERDFAAPPAMVGPSFMERIVQYYAKTRCYAAIPPMADDASIVELVEQTRPDVVVLWPTKYLPAERCQSLVERLEPLGLEPVHPEALSGAAGEFHILVQRRPIACARKPR